MKKLLFQTKFDWPWAGGLVLIMRTVFAPSLKVSPSV